MGLKSDGKIAIYSQDIKTRNKISVYFAKYWCSNNETFDTVNSLLLDPDFMFRFKTILPLKKAITLYLHKLEKINVYG